MKIKVTDEMADKIVTKSLLEHVKYIRADILRLESCSTLKDYEVQDLDANYEFLNAMKIVYRYFTPSSEWNNVD